MVLTPRRLVLCFVVFTVMAHVLRAGYRRWTLKRTPSSTPGLIEGSTQDSQQRTISIGKGAEEATVTPSKSGRIHIATNNVLFEPYYQRHCKVDKVQYTDRLASWVALTTSTYFRSFDVILLQEFPFKDADWVGPLHAAGYSLLPGTRNQRSQEASAIAFRCDRFHIEGQGQRHGEALKAPDCPQTIYADQLASQQQQQAGSGAITYLDYGRGKTAVRAKLKARDSPLVVACVSAHLQWAPSPAERQEIAEKTLQFSTANLDAEIPLFVGGDFNIEADTPFPVPRGKSEAPDHESLSFPARVFSPSKGWWELSTGIRWTQYGARGPSQLDYLFVRWPSALGAPPSVPLIPSTKEFEVNGVQGQELTLSPRLTSTVYPSNPLDLVLHDPPVSQGAAKVATAKGKDLLVPFYSDHAVVSSMIQLNDQPKL
jgi:endonuclease/exonuclease/phosphatase family metal-dependent hydrolase